MYYYMYINIVILDDLRSFTEPDALFSISFEKPYLVGRMYILHIN